MSPLQQPVSAAEAQSVAEASATASVTHRRMLFVAMAGMICGAMAASTPEADATRHLARTAPVLDPVDAGRLPLDVAAFRGQTILINFWASWCLACREEHSLVTSLGGTAGLSVLGVNSHDTRGDALRWLDYFGDPYCRNGYDPSGDAADHFGVSALPTSLVIGPTGRITYRHEGPLTDTVLRRDILPRLDVARPAARSPCDVSRSGATTGHAG